MSFVKITRPRPQVAMVTLDRPERMNAMAFDVMVPLREALEELSFDNSRVVVLTGAGDGFCSGADLVDPGYLPIIDGLTMTGIARRAMKILDDVVKSLREMPQPVIARGERSGDRRWPLPRPGDDIRLAAPSRLLPRRRHQQRAHRDRARAQLPAAARDRLLARLRDHALRPRRIGAEDAERSASSRNAARREELLDAATRSPSASTGYSQVGVELTKRMLWAGLETGSLHRTSTSRGTRSSSCASPPRTSRRPSRRARKGASPTSRTEPVLRRTSRPLRCAQGEATAVQSISLLPVGLERVQQ